MFLKVNFEIVYSWTGLWDWNDF